MDYDVIIIGAGPAGLTAAMYVSRARLKTMVLESFSVAGQAVITDFIENYPGFTEGVSGFELIEKFKKQSEKFGAEFREGTVNQICEYKEKDLRGWKVQAEGKTYTTLSLIIATGAGPRKLGVSGEDALTGKGVSYCATCDGALYRDKSIVVVGGGDTAVEEALFLTKFGKKVTMVHRKDRLRAVKILQERAFANKKLEFIWESEVKGVLGNNKVSALRLKNIKTGKETEFPCEGVFIFVGYEPNTDFLKGTIKLDEKGYITTDGDMKTEKEGIFACGDCRGKILRQIVTACGDGATAAFSAQHYVEKIKGEEYK